MADADLEEIRKARLAQLKAEGGVPSGSGSGGSEAEERQKQEADARAAILAQILQPDAADRLQRIRLVKASRATDVENRLLQLARSGQLRERVTEAQLKELLASLAEHSRGQEGEIVVSRRKDAWNDDDDDDDGLAGL